VIDPVVGRPPSAKLEARVRAALGAATDCAGDRYGLVPLARGSSHVTLLATAGSRRFVVKAAHRSGDPAASPGDRTLVLEAVAGAGLAPPLVASLPAEGITITEYVAGRPVTAGDLEDAGTSASLARLLRRLHTIELPEAPVFALSNHVAAYRAALGDAAAREGRLSAALVELERLVARHEAGRTVTGLGHNDLTLGNVLIEHRLWLIDWEYAGRSDPLFDLATVLALGGLSEGARTTFLAAYFDGAPPACAIERLGCLERLVGLLAAVWAAAELARDPDDARAARWAAAARQAAGR
jgi:aminoglycoside phosphotransferase (APT) family kinase protein